jgi:hypothetical protein
MSFDETAVVNSQFILVDCNSKQSILSACTKVVLEKLRVTQKVKNFPSFHGTLRFIVVCTLAHPEPDESSPYIHSVLCDSF